MTNFHPSLNRGCETWIVREGYEGLVRGNLEYEKAQAELHLHPQALVHDNESDDPSLVNNLRFGDGELLRDGTGDHPGGRTLKGRYIVRVGWDDVRGWFAEVSTSLQTVQLILLNLATRGELSSAQLVRKLSGLLKAVWQQPTTSSKRVSTP